MPDVRVLAGGNDLTDVSEPDDAHIGRYEDGKPSKPHSQLCASENRRMTGKALLVPAAQRGTSAEECRVVKRKPPPDTVRAGPKRERCCEWSLCAHVRRCCNVRLGKRSRDVPDRGIHGAASCN